MGDGNVSRRDFVRGSMVAGLAATHAAASCPAGEAAKVPAPKDESAPGPSTSAAEMPYGTICGRKISRLIFGTNIPGSHSRDLIYVTSLGAHYNTPERMLDTYALAESQGINTVLQGGALVRQYNATRGGHLQTIRPVNVGPADSREEIKRRFAEAAKDDLAAAWYIWGDQGDYLARANRIDQVGVALEVARELGMILGVGSHALEVPIECQQLGIKPDFYVKTLHNDNYWSATPKEYREPFCWYDNKGGNSYSGKLDDHNRFHDNIWCLDPEKTIEVMRQVEVPWIAFKVLAAGAIHPRQGFSFAFRNGADFIAVGMLDFQVRMDAEIARQSVAKCKRRERPWRA